MDKILITGVAGFIGSNLAEHLLKNEKYLVYGLDNFSCSTISNLYPLLKNPRFTLLEQNVSNEINQTFDVIFHFAGNGDFKLYKDNKYDYILELIENTKSIINLAMQSGSKLIIPLIIENSNENYNDFQKLYCANNLIKELYCELIENNKLNAKLVYLDYVYGKNMQKNDLRFINNAILNAFENKPITHEYDECFYFTYIDDVVQNLEKIMNNYIESTCIELVNNSLYLKSDIIRLILNYAKSDSKIDFLTDKEFQPTFKPAKKNYEIDLSCNTSVLEGILQTVKHYKLIYFS